MRQLVLRLVCDGCGLVVHMEVMNSEPLTVTIDVEKIVRSQDWWNKPKEGSSFSTYDLCPLCRHRGIPK